MEIIERKDGLLYVGLMPSELSELRDILNKQDNVIVGLDVMRIYADEGVELKDLNVLNGLDVKRLTINAPGNIDHKALHNQSNLIHLDLRSFDVETFDFNCFPNLKCLYFDWKKGMRHIDRLQNLELMVVRGFKPADKSLSLFSNLINLKELHLIQSTIASLNGIQELSNLVDLSIVYCKNIEFVDAIIYPFIKCLYIENCKKVGLDVLKSMPNLKSLQLQSQPDLATLRPVLEELKQLEELKIYGTKILEQDNAYWAQYKQLKHLEFQDFRHYKVKSDAFIKANQ